MTKLPDKMISLKILAQAIVKLAMDLYRPVQAARTTSSLRSVSILKIVRVSKIVARVSSRTVVTNAPHVLPHVSDLCGRSALR